MFDILEPNIVRQQRTLSEGIVSFQTVFAEPKVKSA